MLWVLPLSFVIIFAVIIVIVTVTVVVVLLLFLSLSSHGQEDEVIVKRAQAVVCNEDSPGG